MRFSHRAALLTVFVGLASCGDDQLEPVARIDVRDLRQEQAQARAPGPVLEPMLVSSREAGVIYDAPPDLTLQPRDSLVTAPFGVTAAPDSAARGARPNAGPSARRDTSTSARRDTSASARRDTITRPRAAPQPGDSVRQP